MPDKVRLLLTVPQNCARQCGHSPTILNAAWLHCELVPAWDWQRFLAGMMGWSVGKVDESRRTAGKENQRNFKAGGREFGRTVKGTGSRWVEGRDKEKDGLYKGSCTRIQRRVIAYLRVCIAACHNRTPPHTSSAPIRLRPSSFSFNVLTSQGRGYKFS